MQEEIDQTTHSLYQRSSTLSSSGSSPALKATKLSFQPKMVHSLESNDNSVVTTTYDHNQHRPNNSFLGSASLTSRSDDKDDKLSVRREERTLPSFQQLDEILEELVSPPKDFPPRPKPRGSIESFESTSSDEDESPLKSSPSKTRTALKEKSVSWVAPRNTSPTPTDSANAALTMNGNLVKPVNQLESTTPTLKKMTRCRSEIISLVDGKAPPLPYNIKPKKKVARRIQSIHHIVERPATPAAGVEKMSIIIPDTPPKSSTGTTTDDEMTTISGSSGSQRRPSVNSSDAGDSVHNSSTASVRSRVKYVPYRVQENSLDLTNFVKNLPLREQIRIATLLSSQEAQYGFNMFDALVPGDKEEINRLMNLGYRYEDAVLMIFEKRYVTRPEEALGGYGAVLPGQHHSAPVSPNISYDYSLHSNAADIPNYSADYAYSRQVCYPQQMYRPMSGYFGMPLSSPPSPYMTTGYGHTFPIAYSPPPNAPTPQAVNIMPLPSPPVIPSSNVSLSSSAAHGLPPKSPKAGSLIATRKPASRGNLASHKSMTSARSQSPEGSYAVPTVARLAAHKP